MSLKKIIVLGMTCMLSVTGFAQKRFLLDSSSKIESAAAQISAKGVTAEGLKTTIEHLIYPVEGLSTLPPFSPRYVFEWGNAKIPSPVGSEGFSSKIMPRNLSTESFTFLTNGHGHAFLSVHAEYLQRLLPLAEFEGFFSSNAAQLQEKLETPITNPTHPAQALADAFLAGLKKKEGFVGVKVNVFPKQADLLILDVNTGIWQSYQNSLMIPDFEKILLEGQNIQLKND